jgi:hypothetical protein
MAVAKLPEPVLFNAWKHHAGALRAFIAAAVRQGEPGLAELARRLVAVGTELMDLYTDRTSPCTSLDAGKR